MFINRLPARALYLLGFAACAMLIGTALYFQYIVELEPCPLCIFQRICVIAMGAAFLVAALHNPTSWGRRIYALVLLVVAAIGAGIAARHVWLQNLPPDQVPECGPDLEFMMNRFPFWDVLGKVLKGSGECAEVLWTFLGLSIPGWTLIMFSVFLLFSLSLLFRKT